MISFVRNIAISASLEDTCVNCGRVFRLSRGVIMVSLYFDLSRSASLAFICANSSARFVDPFDKCLFQCFP